MIKLTIPGEPVAQHRPRITTVGKFPRMYLGKKDNNYREKLYWEAKQLNMKPISRKTALAVQLDVYRPMPKSLSQTKRSLAEAGEILPTTKPDLDNYIKQVCDALNGLVWEDDSQIVTIVANKYFSEKPRLELKIEELKE